MSKGEIQRSLPGMVVHPAQTDRSSLSSAELRFLSNERAFQRGYTGCPHSDLARHPGIDFTTLTVFLSADDADLVEAAIDELSRRVRLGRIGGGDFAVARERIAELSQSSTDACVRCAAAGFLALPPPGPAVFTEQLPPPDPRFRGFHNWGLYLRSGTADIPHFRPGVHPTVGIVGLGGMMTSALDVARLAEMVDPSRVVSTLSLGLHGTDWDTLLSNAHSSTITETLVERLVQATQELRTILLQDRPVHLQFRGFSLGGLIGVIAQQRHPGLFQSMIIASSPWELSLRNIGKLLFVRAASSVVGLIHEVALRVPEAHPHAGALERAAPHPAFVPARLFSIVPPIRAAAKEALSQVTVPTLFLHGGRDTVALPSGSRNAADRLSARGIPSSVHVLSGFHHRALLQGNTLSIAEVVGRFNDALGVPTRQSCGP